MKEKIISLGFVFILFLMPLLSFIIRDVDISKYERRKLKNVESLTSDFLNNYDDYLVDQFPFRNSFITLNSFYERNVLGNFISNDVYVKDGIIYDINYETKKNNVKAFSEKLNYINDNYLQNSKVYYLVILDKAYYLEDDYLKLDYDYILKEVNKNTNIEYIDVAGLFDLNDFYKTDIHLRQEAYFKLINKLSSYLNYDYIDLKYDKNVYKDFYGSSFSKAPYVESDELIYLTNDYQKSVEVIHLEYGKKEIYDLEKLNQVDSYDVFLSGPSAVVTLENKSIINDKEIIIFRDSFASSFAPLLSLYYEKITLIDLRYIDFDYLKNYVSFDNKDVLFLYSTLTINESDILKINVK